jgi:hypothetical protein
MGSNPIPPSYLRIVEAIFQKNSGNRSVILTGREREQGKRPILLQHILTRSTLGKKMFTIDTFFLPNANGDVTLSGTGGALPHAEAY